MSQAGFEVEQNPTITPADLARNPGVRLGREADYRIGGSEGRIFDAISPTSENPFGIRNKIADKVSIGQTTRIVLNLDGNNVSLDAVRQELLTTPIAGLDEVIVVRGNLVETLYVRGQ